MMNPSERRTEELYLDDFVHDGAVSHLWIWLAGDSVTSVSDKLRGSITRWGRWTCSLVDCINPSWDTMVVAIMPTPRDGSYTAAKMPCCVETPVPSQVKSSTSKPFPMKRKSLRSSESCLANQLQARRRVVGLPDSSRRQDGQYHGARC